MFFRGKALMIFRNLEPAKTQSRERAIFGNLQPAKTQSRERAIFGNLEPAKTQSRERAIFGNLEPAKTQSRERAAFGNLEPTKLRGTRTCNLRESRIGEVTNFGGWSIWESFGSQVRKSRAGRFTNQ
jgi:hypothetical protein